jgi:hypothetical protein
VLVNIHNEDKNYCGWKHSEELEKVTVVRLEVLMVVAVKSTVFCSLVGCFGVSACLLGWFTL